MDISGNNKSFLVKLRELMAMPAFPVLLALSAAHSLNDLLQSVISAVYPMLKEELSLDFAQIGLITLVYQISSSIFQPVVGYAFDKRPFVYSLPMGMVSTSVGIAMFSYCNTMAGILIAVFLVGIGSATLHPEASRITSLAGRERRGFAQSVFQVGGNFGGSIGPLLVALIVAPHGRHYVLWFLVFSTLAFAAMRPMRAVSMYYYHKDDWRKLQKRGMACDFSWSKSATRYNEMYAGLITK